MGMVSSIMLKGTLAIYSKDQKYLLLTARPTKRKTMAKKHGTDGNKHAEKWTEGAVLEKLEEIEEHASENYTLNGSLLDCGLYPEWWSHMTEKFKSNPTVSQAIKRVETKIEKRIVEATMDGTAKSAAFSIFLLKNKHGYRDRTETDITSQGDKIPNNITVEIVNPND